MNVPFKTIFTVPEAVALSRDNPMFVGQMIGESPETNRTTVGDLIDTIAAELTPDPSDLNFIDTINQALASIVEEG